MTATGTGPDPLAGLRDTGFPVDQMTAEQQEVLASLTEDEREFLISVELRLRAAEGEVVAHEMKLL